MPSNGLSEPVKRMAETGIGCRDNGQRGRAIGLPWKGIKRTASLSGYNPDEMDEEGYDPA
jgi:hypothetical protein